MVLSLLRLLFLVRYTVLLCLVDYWFRCGLIGWRLVLGLLLLVCAFDCWFSCLALLLVWFLHCRWWVAIAIVFMTCWVAVFCCKRGFVVV